MKRTIFLAKPLSSHDGNVHDLVRNALDAVGERLHDTISIVGPSFAPGRSVMEQLREGLAKADLLLADVSKANPNVLWEVGFAQAMGKPVILIARDPSEIPFDLREQSFLLYGGTSGAHIASRLEELFFSAFSKDEGKAGGRGSDLKTPRTVFISYCRKDAEYLDRILVHLRPLERDGLIDPWSDQKIEAGDRWRKEIETALERAGTAILLISADFLASEFIVNDELPPLLAAAEEKGTRIIPIILKPSRFRRDSRLARFQALNKPSAPVIRMAEADREELYAELAEIVERDLDLAVNPSGR